VTHSTQDQQSAPDGRILPFRRPGMLARNVTPPPPVPDLEKYERTPEEPDDYRHRMLMNGLGLGITVMLVLAGIWMADVMAHMRKDQDCALIGRQNCAQIDVPAPAR
jgi:hypothetical protein